MQFLGSIEAMNALLDFIIDRTAPLPNRLRDQLRETLKEPSTVVGIVRAVELVYARDARRADVPDAMLEWAAAAAVMTEDSRFHGMADNGRGSKIARMLRRQAVAEAEQPDVDAEIAERAAPLPTPDVIAQPPVAEPPPV